MLTYTAIAPAKINLRLRVYPKAAGEEFHKVENTMQTLSLHDKLTFLVPENESDLEQIRSKRNRLINDYYGIKETQALTYENEGFSITILIDDHTGQNLDIPVQNNLITKAILKAAEVSDIASAPAVKHIDVWLEKNIPAQAGLGGGSSNAAATLQMTKELFGLSEEDVMTIAANIGSDVPYFLTGGRAAMSDTGATLAETLPSLKEPVVLVKPQAGVSTKACYAQYDTMSGSTKPTGKYNLVNDLQKPACTIEPAIADVLKLLKENCEPENVLMSGSGSACFAICDSFEKARKTAAKATSQGYWARACSCAKIKASLID